MPDNYNRIIAAGFDQMMVAQNLSDGFTPGGITGTIANGSSAAPRRMYGVKTANPQIPEPGIVNVTGDDTRLGIFTFDSDASPTFELVSAELDMDIVAASQGTNIYTVGTYYNMNLVAPIGRDFPDMMLWAVSQSKGRAPGQKNATYHSLVMPKCTLTYRSRNFEERAAANFPYSVVVNPFDRLPWGGGSFAGDNAFGKGEAFMFEFVTNMRPQILVIKDDTTSNTFNLDYTPWQDGNGNVRFIAWRNGVVVGQTGSTGAVFVSTAGVVTISGLSSRVAGDTIFIFAEVA